MDAVTDEILLLIFRCLSYRDLRSITRVCKRFNRVAEDSALHRSVVFDDNRGTSVVALRKYVATHSQRLENLTLTDCYWIPPSLLVSALLPCESLKKLNLIGSRLSIAGLIKVAQRNRSLKWLGWSIPHGSDGADLLLKGLPTKLCKEIQRLFKNLCGLALRFETLASLEHWLPVFSQELNLFEFGLECLSDRTSTYISNGNFYCMHLKSEEQFSVCLNDNIVANPYLHSNLLLMHFVIQAATKAAETNCMSILLAPGSMNSLCWKYIMPVLQTASFKKVDLSHSQLGQEQIQWLFSLHQLTYLNLSSVSAFKANLLRAMANNCSSLLTLNLSHCQEWVDEDLCGLAAIAKHCENLSSLSLCGLHIHGTDESANKLCSILSSMVNLKALAVPACGLTNEVDYVSQGSGACCTSKHHSPQSSQTIGISQLALPVSGSISLSGECSTSTYVTRKVSSERKRDADISKAGSGLDLLCKCCELVELEIIDVGFHSVFSRLISSGERYLCPTSSRLQDKAFLPILQMTLLRRLTIAGLSGLGNFSSLVDITANCPHLEFLSLAHIGMLGHSGSLIYLKQAVSSCKNLVTFRLDQPHFHVNEALLRGFHSCPRLESLCIVNKNGQIPKDLEAYSTLFLECPRLSAFYLFSGGSVGLSKSIQNTLLKQYARSRPPLSIAVMPFVKALTEEGLKGIPYALLREVVWFDSRVSSCKPATDR